MKKIKRCVYVKNKRSCGVTLPSSIMLQLKPKRPIPGITPTQEQIPLVKYIAIDDFLNGSTVLSTQKGKGAYDVNAEERDEGG